MIYSNSKLVRLSILSALIASAIVLPKPVKAQKLELGEPNKIELEEPKYNEIKTAVAEFRQGKFSECLKQLQAAVENYPELPPAEVIQAKLFLANNRKQEATDMLEQAVARHKEDPEAFLMLGDLALRDRQITLAELAINHAAKLTKQYNKNEKRLADLNKRTLAGQTTISQIRGMLDETIAFAKAWSELDKQNPRPHHLMAFTYFQQKKYNEAYAELKEVSKLNKNAPRAEIALAQLYEEAGHRDTAKESMELAIKNGGDELTTRLAVANWALSAGYLEMVKSNLQAATKLEPESLEIKVLRGRLARYSGDRETAIKELQAAVVQSPSHYGATNQLALTLADSEEPKDIQRGLQYAVVNLKSHSDVKNSAGREAAVTYAWLAFKSGQSAEAEKAIQLAIRGGAISSESAYYIAKIASTSGNNALAVKILEPVLNLNNSFPHHKDAQTLLKDLTEASEKE